MSASDAALTLGPELLDRLYPFHFALDHELRILRHGPALKKVCPNVAPGVALHELVRVFRPRLMSLSAEEVQRANHSVFLLDSLATNIRLRGELMRLAEHDAFLFVGGPWFTDIEVLQKSGLDLKDFTINDPLVDFLYMVQAKSLALEDAKRFSEMVVKQRDELRATNAELERANAAKTQFLANTSHELRTPLNGIIGMNSLLLRGELGPKQRGFAQRISQSAELLLSIVNDILDISKVEAGKLTLDSVGFDLPGLLHDVASIFATPAHQKGLEIVCVTDPSVPQAVVGDPARLRQVLANLIGNAMKFTSTGEIALRAELVESKPESARVRCAVRDTGIGIKPEDRSALFKPFSQVDGSMSRRFGGTGLGLAISRQLVQLMGGEIGVESEPGKGSEFWFTLELKHGTPAPVETAAPRPVTGRRVLVVDDSITNREYLVRVLRHHGCEAEAVDSAVAALTRLRKAHDANQPFEVALLDMQMPGMSGIDLALILTADPKFTSLKRLLLASMDVQSDPRLAAVRLDGSLMKPIRPDALVEAIFSAIAGTAANVSEPSASAEDGAAPSPRAPTFTPPPPEPNATAEVLVVDDNPVNVEVAVHMLESLGHRADVATNGEEAVKAVLNRPYRLVLMDLQMPVMDGYTATREIRQLGGELGRVPIVAMTAHAADSDRRNALALGLDDYLAKPARVEQVAALIDKWLRKKPEPPPDIMGELRAMGDGGFVLKLIRTYLADFPRRIEAMEHAAGLADLGRIASAAHALRSSSALVGADDFARLCGDIERTAKLSERDQVHDLVERFRGTAPLVRAELEERLKSTSATEVQR